VSSILCSLWSDCLLYVCLTPTSTSPESARTLSTDKPSIVTAKKRIHDAHCHSVWALHTAPTLDHPRVGGVNQTHHHHDPITRASEPIHHQSFIHSILTSMQGLAVKSYSQLIMRCWTCIHRAVPLEMEGE
jgi:hypothetical protein